MINALAQPATGACESESLDPFEYPLEDHDDRFHSGIHHNRPPESGSHTMKESDMTESSLETNAKSDRLRSRRWTTAAASVVSLAGSSVSRLLVSFTLIGFTMSTAFADPPAAATSTRDELLALVQGKETSPDQLKEVADKLEKSYEGGTAPEATRMLIAIARGSMMGPNEGWFGPGQARYDFRTLAARHGIEPDGSIDATQFQGKPEWFARLDRNRSGSITAEDLDWSDRNPWVQHAYMVNRLLRRLDTKGDGSLTREEWTAFFETVSGGKNEVTLEELRSAWLAGISSSFYPGDAPTQTQLLKGLFAGEVGSMQEGPQINAPAPDFTLKTHDGRQTVHLADVIGRKPVVLVFGNFTCGPFRSMYPGVEDVYRRFHDEAVFLGVYVREAHPTDGWKMESNARVGVAVSQPQSYDERTAVAQQCHRLLKPSIPLLVDDIQDTTGHAYSGMPARLYVIDLQGKVTYKSGRGPFGFKVGEMEQALLMTLQDALPAATGK
jgi:alkyl hydroperoxide reductase subunit AhpC